MDPRRHARCAEAAQPGRSVRALACLGPPPRCLAALALLVGLACAQGGSHAQTPPSAGLVSLQSLAGDLAAQVPAPRARPGRAPALALALEWPEDGPLAGRADLRSGLIGLLSAALADHWSELGLGATPAILLAPEEGRAAAAALGATAFLSVRAHVAQGRMLLEARGGPLGQDFWAWLAGRPEPLETYAFAALALDALPLRLALDLPAPLDRRFRQRPLGTLAGPGPAVALAWWAPADGESPLLVVLTPDELRLVPLAPPASAPSPLEGSPDAPAPDLGVAAAVGPAPAPAPESLGAELRISLRDLAQSETPCRDPYGLLLPLPGTAPPALALWTSALAKGAILRVDPSRGPLLEASVAGVPLDWRASARSLLLAPLPKGGDLGGGAASWRDLAGAGAPLPNVPLPPAVLGFLPLAGRAALLLPAGELRVPGRASPLRGVGLGVAVGDLDGDGAPELVTSEPAVAPEPERLRVLALPQGKPRWSGPALTGRVTAGTLTASGAGRPGFYVGALSPAGPTGPIELHVLEWR